MDTHNDILNKCFVRGYSFDQNLKGKTHSDLERFKEAGIDVQVFSVWCDGKQKDPFTYANRQLDTLYSTAMRNPMHMVIVKTYRQLLKAVHQNKLAAMIGIEGGHMIEADILKLDSLYKRGVRYMTLTWNNSTPWATAAMEEAAWSDLSKTSTTGETLMKQKGLTDFGKQVVKRMNELGDVG